MSEINGRTLQRRIADAVGEIHAGHGVHAIVSHHLSVCYEQYAAQEAEIEQLRAIVDKLPKTADGVPVSFGDELYCIDSQTQWTGDFVVRGAIIEQDEQWLIITDLDHERWNRDCYSTQEAAEKARTQ